MAGVLSSLASTSIDKSPVGVKVIPLFELDMLSQDLTRFLTSIGNESAFVGKIYGDGCYEIR